MSHNSFFFLVCGAIHRRSRQPSSEIAKALRCPCCKRGFDFLDSMRPVLQSVIDKNPLAVTSLDRDGWLSWKWQFLLSGGHYDDRTRSVYLAVSQFASQLHAETHTDSCFKKKGVAACRYNFPKSAVVETSVCFGM